MNSDVDLSQLAISREPDRTLPGRRPRHLWSRYILPGGLLLGFLGLIGWSTRDWVFPPHAVTVTSVITTRATAQAEGTLLFQAAGWVEPRPRAVRVTALAPGVVKELFVVEGQAVAAEEPIAQLVEDDARLALESAQADQKLRRAECDQAQAALDAARTRLENPIHLEAELSEAQAALAKVQTELQILPFEKQRAKARLEYAQRAFEGKSSATGAIAGRAIDEARRELTSISAQVVELEGHELALKAEQAALEARRDALAKILDMKTDEHRAKEEADAMVKTAEARLEQAGIAIKEAQLRLERMTVRSPIEGRVLEVVVTPGARLSSGMGSGQKQDSSTVATLYRSDMLQVRVDVRFEDLPRVTPGQAVRINCPALKSPVGGEVLFLSSEADIQKNTLEAKVTIDSPPALFRPEMLVDVTFLAPAPVERTESTDALSLLLPKEYVFHDASGSYVWVADQSAGIARKTPIEIGSDRQDGLVEITEGLTPASRIISSSPEDLKDRMRIQVSANTKP